jgi:site-specific DNA-methyltransferase (adenine-specific)
VCMKPYYETPLGKLYHGDCLEIMPELPQVDLILTDPPYANGTDYASYSDTEENLKNTVSRLFPLITEKSKLSMITCGVANINLYPKPKWVMAWVTPAGTGSGPFGFCCWQPILIYGDCPYLKNGKGRKQDVIVHTEASPKNGHPCPKPYKIISKLIQRGTINETDTVLDIFCGSGTTPLACERLGRKWFGIEIEEKYCEIAAKRIEAERKQLKLF